MGYEFNPQSQRFDVPNPHRVENLFLAVGAVLMIASGFTSLFIARTRMSHPDNVAGWAALGAAVLTLFAGFTLVAWILWQLRFYFGRDQPSSLAPNMSPTQTGGSKEAQAITETMRQNAFHYPVPVSGIDQLLYTWMPDLIFSPLPLQDIARVQFRNLLAFAAILVSALIAVFGVSNPGQRPIVFMLYCIMGIWILLRALRGGATQISVFSLIVLSVMAVVGPVLMQTLLPANLPLPVEMNWAALAALVVLGGIVATTLLLFSVLAQTLRPTTISMTNHLEVVSFNGAPNQISLHFARALQELWFEKIPNRRYIDVPPQLTGSRGMFVGEMLEESQPVPTESSALTLSYCLSAREYRHLIAVTSLALLLIAGSSAMTLLAIWRWPAGAFDLVAGSGLSFLLALFCLGSSRRLWRRFRFTSRLYWLELQGNFQESNVDYGNLLQGFRSQKTVTSVEDMTLRLWVADVDSIYYGHDSKRYMVGMAGNSAESDRLGLHLAEFARSQSVIVSPTSARDAERVSQISGMNQGSALPDSKATIVPLPAEASRGM
ncbi:MAG: hypothetical protein LBE59_06225 [Nevskiaceae bacterium]|jgi:hypothetical protein|nr:hypothetical protein [Nevskiaceae bacterium]